MDLYKVKQLEIMIEHESSKDQVHYGAHLKHSESSAKELTIDKGGLLALRDYYMKHDTDLENEEE